MGDFNLKLIAEDLGKSLENLSPQIELEIHSAVKDIAFGAYANIISGLQSGKHAPIKRSTYLKALSIGTIPGGYIISLEGTWANRLEDGYGSYSIKDLLLASTKSITKGKNAGKPFVRTNKQGGKFAHVPFQKHPYSQDPGVGDLDQLIKKISATNREGKKQKMTSLFRDLEGNPVQGRAASVGPYELAGAGITDSKLIGLTKYQEKTESGASKSFYVVFRTVAEKSQGWRHPGAAGYGLFPVAERYVDSEVNRILKTLL